MEIADLKVKAQIWDTAGQERYKAFSSAYYSGAHAAMIAYDITDRSSFDNVKMWVRDLGNHVDLKKTTIMLVGNKTDLDQLRQVQVQEGRDLAKKNSFFFIETSALLDKNGEVNKAFSTIIKRICCLIEDLYESGNYGSAEETKVLKPVQLSGYFNVKNDDAESKTRRKYCCF